MIGGRFPAAVAALLAATVAVYAAMVFATLPHLAALATTGGAIDARMFDLRPAGYDLETARTLLAALGPAGRGEYLEVQQRLDTVFPALEGLSFFVGFAFVARRLGWPRAVGRLAALVLALPATLLDWSENAAVAVLLERGPAGIDADMVARASAFTVAKSAAVTVAALLLIAGLLEVARRHFLARVP